jgi:predicted Co/Zn/Cd cation transporter (cation efflux family)
LKTGGDEIMIRMGIDIYFPLLKAVERVLFSNRFNITVFEFGFSIITEILSDLSLSKLFAIKSRRKNEYKIERFSTLSLLYSGRWEKLPELIIIWKISGLAFPIFFSLFSSVVKIVKGGRLSSYSIIHRFTLISAVGNFTTAFSVSRFPF